MGASFIGIPSLSNYQDSAGTALVTQPGGGAADPPVGLVLDLSGLGNHATQSTSTARPKLSARVNLLTKTEQFSDAVWFKASYGGGLPPAVIANDASGPASDGFADKVTFSAGAGAQSLLYATVAFSPAVYRGVLCLKAASPGDVGKIIALRHAAAATYLLITLTADYQVLGNNETSPTVQGGALDIALRPDVGTSSGEVSIHLAYASITLATDAHLPYQCVTDSTDYDADPAKFPYYLSFDGTDDAMTSAAVVPMSGSDKVMVGAGVTKMSDAANTVFFESSSSISSNNGAFCFSAPDTPGDKDFTFASKGTSQTTSAILSKAGPISSALLGVGDISAPGTALHFDGTPRPTNTSSQGTGNYANYTHYLGARSAASAYFNGRIHGILARGGASTPEEQALVTAWLASKQKRTL